MIYIIVSPLKGVTVELRATKLEFDLGPFRFCLDINENLEKYLTDKKFVNKIGQIDYKEIKKYPAFFAVVKSEERIETLSSKYELWATGIIDCLWLVKDSAIFNNTLFISNESHSRVHRRIQDVTFTNCTGQFSDTTITEADLVQAVNYLEKIGEFMDYGSTEIDVQDLSNSSSTTELGSINMINYSLHNRIVRAWMFLVKARKESLLPAKIAFYVAVFECLFTTDNTEVTHKVCERVAFYMGTTNSERFKIYGDLSDGYGIRSSYLHGQKLNSKIKSKQQLSNISLRLDSLLRQTLKKVIDINSEIFLDEKNLGQWFKRLIFGDANSDQSV